MADLKTQYVVAHDSAASPPSSALLSPRTKVARGWLRLRQSAHRFWMLEAIASVLSLLIFTAIIVILYFLDNRIYGDAAEVQGDKERRPHIFPILAFMSAVMRATMLLPVATAIGQLKWSWFRSARRLIDIERFDEAARGILGSAKLMFYLRFRNLATIGAALTILALPLDALIQSAIRMPSKIELVDNLRDLSSEFQDYQNETFLTKATSYTKYQVMTNPDDVWPEPAMVNAIQYGLGYSNGPSDFMKVTTNVDCQTGYCNFTQAQTLNIGYKCTFRDDIEYIARNGDFAPYQTLPGTDLKLYVEGYNGVAKHQIAVASYSEYPTNRTTPPYHGDSYERDIFGRIQGPLIARTSMLINRFDAVNQAAKDSTYGIDCALFWNVKTTTMYVNKASNHTLSWIDDKNATSNFRFDKGWGWILTPKKCVVDGDRVPGSNESSYDETFYRNNCVYWIHNKTHTGIQTMLKDPDYGLLGDLKLIGTIPGTNSSEWNQRNPFIMNVERASWTKTPDQALVNIQWMWNNMAYFAGFTVRGRESMQMDGSSVNLYIKGNVSALVTYYLIDWARLSMPAFIVVGCAFFVIYTALLTRREYAWRRSALPLLFHGLEDHERLAQGDVRDFNAMQEAAKQIRVRLTEHVDENGARLTTQN